jgi:predicted RNA-binding Zn-ribbon protein involved in translation (DUF1610 family)
MDVVCPKCHAAVMEAYPFRQAHQPWRKCPVCGYTAPNPAKKLQAP